MGGFPSHDAAGFLYTTAVQHPTNGGTTEVCLVPLLRRYFNDSNKKLKDSVTQLYFHGPPNTTQIATSALQQQLQQQQQQTPSGVNAPNTPTSSGPTPPGTPPAAGSLTPAGTMDSTASITGSNATQESRKQQAIAAYKAMEHHLGEIEASFFTNTRVVFESGDMARIKSERVQATREVKKRAEDAFLFDATRCKDALTEDDNDDDENNEKGSSDSHDSDANGEKEKKDGAEAGSAGGGAAEGTAAVKKPATSSSAKKDPVLPPMPELQPPQRGKLDPTLSWPVMRPVPCAICIIEPETSNRKASTGGTQAGAGDRKDSNAPATGMGAATQQQQQQAMLGSTGMTTITDWATVQGRKLHCVGYLSCFSDYCLPMLGRHAQPGNVAGAQHDKGVHAAAGFHPATPSQQQQQQSSQSQQQQQQSNAAAAGGASQPSGGERPGSTFNVPRLRHCSDNGYDVYVEILLENEETQRYLIEAVLFLACITFRSQFMTCGMSQRPLCSKEVEETYYHHLDLLNVHVMISKTRYQPLKSFYEQYPLIELVDELGVSDKCLVRSLSQGGSASGTGPASGAAGAGGGSGSNTLQQEMSGTGTANEEGVLSEGGADASGSAVLQKEASESDPAGGAAATAATAAAAAGGESKASVSLTGGDMETSTSRRSRRSRRQKKKQRTQCDQEEIYRLTTCRMPRFDIYELHTGEYGVEINFEGGLLARFMKYITETAAFETVKGSYIRCDLGPLMKDRRHLLQLHRESMQEFFDQDEEEERLFGGDVIAASIKAWLHQGAVAEDRKRQTQSLAQAAAHVIPVTTVAGAPAQVFPGMPGLAPAAAAAAAASAGQQQVVMYVPGIGFVATTAQAAAQAAAASGAQAAMAGMATQPVAGAGQAFMIPQGAAGHPQMAAAPQAQYMYNPATGQTQLVAMPPSARAAYPMMAMPQPQALPQYYYPPNAAAAQPAQAAPAPAAPAAAQPMQYQYVMGPNGQLMLMPVQAAPQMLQQFYVNNYYLAQQQAAVAAAQQQAAAAQQAAVVAQHQQAAAAAAAVAQQQPTVTIGVPASASQTPTAAGSGSGSAGHAQPQPSSATGSGTPIMAASATPTHPGSGAPLSVRVGGPAGAPPTAATSGQAAMQASTSQTFGEVARPTVGVTSVGGGVAALSHLSVSAVMGSAAAAAAAATTTTTVSGLADTSRSPFDYDDEDDEDTAKAIAAATAAMALGRSSGGAGGRRGRHGDGENSAGGSTDSSSDDDDDNTHNYFSGGQFFFQSQ